MWTWPCIIMIVLLLVHCGFDLPSPFLCCMLSILCTMTYPVTLVLWYYDITIAYPCFVLLLKKYPTPCRRCFVILMLLLLCDSFGLIFRFFVLCFLSSVLVSCGGLVRCISWPPLEIVRCLEFVSIDVSFWSLVSHVPVLLLFPVSSYLLLSHPVVVPFFSLDAVDLRCPLFLPTFWHSCWIRKNYRFSGSWLICSWKLSRLPWHFVCLLMSSCVAFFIPVDFDSVLFASSFVLFGRWLQHQGLTGPIGFLSDAG